MEISIKWNVCRICLSEELNGQGESADNVSVSTTGAHMRPIFEDAKLAQQIYDCSGIKMKPNDNMPDKICRQCLRLLKCAVHFHTTCRNSNEYLQSVIEKTKSASALLKRDRQSDHTVELSDDIFTVEDLELRSQEGASELTSEGKQSLVLEVIGESVTENGAKLVVEQQPQSQSTAKNIHSNTSFVVDSQQGDAEKPALSIKSVTSLSEEKDNGNVELVELLLEEEQTQEEINDSENGGEEKEKQQYHKVTTSEFGIDDEHYVEDDDALDDSVQHHDNISYKIESKEYVGDMAQATGGSEEINDGDVHHTNATPASTIEEDEEEAIEAFYYVVDEQEIKRECNDEGSDPQTIELFEPEPVMEGGEGDIEVGDCGEGIHHNSATESYEEYLVEELAETDQDQEMTLTPRVMQRTRGKGRPKIVSAQSVDGEGRAGGGGGGSGVANSRSVRRTWSPHMRKKVGDTFVYICDVCGNQFTNRSLLNYHMRIHRNEKNYECELCFKRFSAACNLTAHMRIHTGERPFECKFCQRRFTDRSTHIKHERIHTNEKPFQCDTCKKRFSLSTTLRAHEKLHTGEKPFKCLQCNKSFTLPHQLKAHLNTNLHKCLALEKNTAALGRKSIS